MDRISFRNLKKLYRRSNEKNRGISMHLLVPTESINRYIELMGELDEVKNDIFKIDYLADLYKVPTIIIKLKLNYLN